MRHTRSFPLALVMAGSSLWTATAFAEGPKVLLLPYQPVSRQASPELCTQVTTVLTNELSGSDAITMVASAGEAAGAAAEEQKPSAEAEKAEAAAKAALDKALTLSQAGDKQVKKLKFDPAIKTLTQALQQFEAAAAAVTDVGPITQAHLNLAVAYWKRGMEDESMAEMAAAARLDPELKPDPKEYWPLFLRVYDQQWRKALRAKRTKVKVDATVPGAEVFFNGKSVGATPLVLTNVVPGHHYVRVVKEGAGAFGARVDAKAEEPIEVTADLAGNSPASPGLGPVANGITSNHVDDAVVAAAAALGKAQGADFVLFGGVAKGERGINVATFMVAVKDGKAGRLVDLEFDLDLLSASVESFKLVEEVGSRVKSFGDTLAKGSSQAVVRGMVGAESGGGGITEVDVGPAMPDAKASKDPAQEGRSRVNDDGGEEGGSRAIGGEEEGGKKKKPRATMGDGRTAASRGDDYKPTTPFYLNPLFIVPIIAVAAGVGILGVLMLAGGGTAGGVAAYVLLAPPQTATVEATWPN